MCKVDNDYYKNKTIVANGIDREEDLFLCGLKTQKEWKAGVFMRKMRWNLL